MTEKTLTEMSEDEFQTVIDEYIERSSHQTGEMPASTFFALLFEKAAQRAAKTVEVEGRIESGKLKLSLPTEREATEQAHDNEILVDDVRIVVTLKDGDRSSTT